MHSEDLKKAVTYIIRNPQFFTHSLLSDSDLSSWDERYRDAYQDYRNKYAATFCSHPLMVSINKVLQSNSRHKIKELSNLLSIKTNEHKNTEKQKRELVNVICHLGPLITYTDNYLWQRAELTKIHEKYSQKDGRDYRIFLEELREPNGAIQKICYKLSDEWYAITSAEALKKIQNMDDTSSEKKQFARERIENLQVRNRLYEHVLTVRIARQHIAERNKNNNRIKEQQIKNIIAETTQMVIEYKTELQALVKKEFSQVTTQQANKRPAAHGLFQQHLAKQEAKRQQRKADINAKIGELNAYLKVLNDNSLKPEQKLTTLGDKINTPKSKAILAKDTDPRAGWFSRFIDTLKEFISAIKFKRQAHCRLPFMWASTEGQRFVNNAVRRTQSVNVLQQLPSLSLRAG